jgi:CheY-like chemotaxis protein
LFATWIAPKLCLYRSIREQHTSDASGSVSHQEGFPALMAKAAAKSSAAEPKSAQQEKSGPKSKRILLVDDDQEIIESMRITLEAKGYQVLVARDGNQGLVMCEKEDPDLVILDMMMPKRSGFLVLEKLRRTRPVPLRVIMVTANEGSRHKAYAEMLGVDDYIRKPFAMDRLLDSIERLLA